MTDSLQPKQTGRSTMQPRGRKKELKGDARRREILSAVRKLLSDGTDFSQLNVASVAREAGMSRPTFYFYFESKFEVLSALVAEIRTDLIERADSLFSGEHQNPMQELQNALQGVVDTWKREKAIMQAFSEAAASDASLWALLGDFVEDFVEPTSRTIVAIHATQGRMTSLEDAQKLVRALLWGNERNLHRAVIENFDDEQWNELTQTLTAIWAGAVLYQA